MVNLNFLLFLSLVCSAELNSLGPCENLAEKCLVGTSGEIIWSSAHFCPTGATCESEQTLVKALTDQASYCCCKDYTTSSSTSPSVNPSCPRQECEEGFYWQPEPICACFLICDYIDHCPSGQKWDFIKCGCVDFCPSTACPENHAPNSECECECALSDEICREDFRIFDPSNCACNPDWGCDYILSCPPGQKWDFDVCGCIDACPGVSCFENFAVNDECECVCNLTQEICNEQGAHVTFDPNNCYCMIEWGCDYIMSCEPGQKWDFEECGCIDACPGVSCFENFAVDDECECVCNLTQEICYEQGPHMIFDANNCACNPEWGCDYIMSCEPGQKWDFDVCGCIDACPGVLCGENFAVNDECECVCNLTQEICSEQGAHVTFDPNNCYCMVEWGCDYIMSCEPGQKWDFGVCGCIDACPSTFCSENFAVDDSCQCICSLTDEICSESGGMLNTVDCHCIWPNHCDNIKSCPKQQKWDPVACQCVDICSGKFCFENNECPDTFCPEFLAPNENCECECAIYEKICSDEGLVFDSDQCKCVDSCPGLTCDGNFEPNFESCRCECLLDSPPQPCSRSYFWNKITCSCMLGCDFIRECPYGEVWDIFECGCINPCPHVSCFENYSTDENCNCYCNLSADNCKEGTVFDQNSCSCQRDCEEQSCPSGEYFDSQACRCMSSCPDVYCDENFEIDSESCLCKCALDESDCPANTEFSLSECACDHKLCEPTKKCPENSAWSYQTCDCECNSKCEGGFTLNQTTCECQCLLSEENCPGPLAYLDWDFCECRRHPCDPPWPCPDGEIIDWEICNCAPDPNASCLPLECDENFAFDQAACSCVCPLSESDCSGPMEYLNHDFCACFRHPCDPPYPCPSGQIIDWEICNCVDAETSEEPCGDEESMESQKSPSNLEGSSENELIGSSVDATGSDRSMEDLENEVNSRQE